MTRSKNKTVEYTDGAKVYEALRQKSVVRMGTEDDAAKAAYAHLPPGKRTNSFFYGFMGAWKRDEHGKSRNIKRAYIDNGS